MALRKIKLGSFAAGEIPPPIVHQYRDHAGAAIPMTGWTILGFYVEGGTDTNGVMSWVDASVGRATYVWHPDDMQTVGRYRGLMWVQNDIANPTIRLASDQFEWDVQDGPGPTPPTAP